MNIEEFRDYCLSLKGVTEKMPFVNTKDSYARDAIVFSVGDKWFCFVNINLMSFCVMKSTPAESAMLQEQYDAVKPGYHMNKKHWISVYFGQDMIDTQILQQVHRAYEIVVQSLPKNKREQFLPTNLLN